VPTLPERSLAALVVLAATTVATSGSANVRPTSTIRLDAVVTSFHKIDVAPKGDSAGDAFQVTDRLTLGHTMFGHDDVSCVHADDIYYECSWTVVLRGGTVQTLGVAHDTNAAYELAIVGGTGSYSGARGMMTVTDALKSVAHYDLELVHS
jgi:hypothetical protein